LTQSPVVRVAVLGVGQWGANLARTFAQLGVLAATSDIRTDSSLADERCFGVPARSYPAILSDGSIQAVVIATPSKFHYVQAKAALLVGKHVFVEKPMAFRMPEAEELVELARARGLVLMTGHVVRFHPAIRRIIEMVKAGAVGSLQYVTSQRLAASASRNMDSAIWDLAPHDISVVLALAGEEPDWVESYGAIDVPGAGEALCHIHMGFRSGLRSHIYVSKVHPFKEVRLVLTGEKGSIVFETSDSHPRGSLILTHASPGKLSAGRVSGPLRQIIAFDDGEPLKAECQDFIDSIVSRRAPLTDGHEALGVLRVLTAASGTGSCSRPGENANPAHHESAELQSINA
jgi:UDP-2-acetamido-3-amino-2,3-dideoxy-glucuronate N-acetyltransferase